MYFNKEDNTILSTERNISMRPAKLWTAINTLLIIWKSYLSPKIKWNFFHAAVLSMLLYGCSSWILTKHIEKQLDVNCTRMLLAILNKSWKQHTTKQQLYNQLPLISKTIQIRGTRHAGHYWRSKNKIMWRSSIDAFTWTRQCWATKKNLPTTTLCRTQGVI